jgi:hypothetical protein
VKTIDPETGKETYGRFCLFRINDQRTEEKACEQDVIPTFGDGIYAEWEIADAPLGDLFGELRTIADNESFQSVSVSSVLNIIDASRWSSNLLTFPFHYNCIRI